MRNLRAALSLLVLMTLAVGLAYPLLMTGVGLLIFPRQAAGGLIYRNTTLVGSSLIGQHFAAAQYFWSRPSATSPQPNDALASGASNLGPLNPALLQAVDANSVALRRAASRLAAEHGTIPVDLVTASASGLDPDISIAAARFQSARIARARNIPQSQVDSLIAGRQSTPLFGIIGEPHVNVLQLNLALDQMHE